MNQEQNNFRQFESKLLLFQRSIRLHEAQWFAYSKLTLLETMLLRFITLDGPHKMKDVSSRFEIKLSTLTSVIDKLERKSFIVRKHTPNDRRVILLHPSSKGKKRFEDYRTFLGESLKQLHIDLEDEQFSFFIEAIQSFHLAVSNSLEIDNDEETA